jgi:hypothetical protein
MYTEYEMLISDERALLREVAEQKRELLITKSCLRNVKKRLKSEIKIMSQKA